MLKQPMSAILARLERIEEKLDAALARERRRVNRESLFLSRREAARLLGIDRKTLLAWLINEGYLPLVQHGKRWCLRREDVERLARDGFPAPGAPSPRATRRRQPRANAAAGFPKTQKEIIAEIKRIQADLEKDR